MTKRRWRVEVWWPGTAQAEESALRPDDVQISDGGVLRMFRNGEQVAVYGPGFWVAADWVEED